MPHGELVKKIIIRTGRHYDHALSGGILELEIPSAMISLGVAPG